MKSIVTLLLLMSLLALSGCGFANNMTGRVIRGAPQVVIGAAL